MSALVTRIRRAEGFRPAPYLCPAGHVTVGYGCNLEAWPCYIPDAAIRAAVQGGRLEGPELLAALAGAPRLSPDEAEAVLREQLSLIQAELHLAFPWLRDLDQPRREVLLEMAFTLGVPGLRGFVRLLAAVRRSDFDTAAREMLDSAWARQVGDWHEGSRKARRTGGPGRAWALARIMREGAPETRADEE